MKIDLSKVDWVVILKENGESIRFYPESFSYNGEGSLCITERKRT